MKKKGEIVVPAFSWSFPPGLSKLALALLASAASTVQLTSLGIGALLYWGCCSNGGCLGSFGRQWSRGRTRGRTATYYSNVVGRRSRAPRWSVVMCYGGAGAHWRQHWLWDSNSFCSNSKRAHSAYSLCTFYRFLNLIFLAAIRLMISVMFYIC